jgi:hypothetical protein
MTDQPPPGDRPPVKGDLFDERPTDLVAYLRRYGDRYTRDAMAARLIEAGYDADAVETAVAALDVEAPTATSADDDHERARLVSRAILVGAVLLLATWILGGRVEGPGSAGFAVATLGLAAFFAVVGTWWMGRVRSVGAMIAITMLALMVGLPVAFLGGCFAYFNTGGRLF